MNSDQDKCSMSDVTGQIQIVTFQLGDELYGIDIMDVREIVRLQEVRPIPNAPGYVEGIINLREEIIPIINLHRRFNLKKAELDEGDQLLSGFLIIELDSTPLGVLIDKVSRVITRQISEIHSPPQMLSGIGKEYIQGVTNEENGYLIILDIYKLFDPRELQQLGSIGN